MSDRTSIYHAQLEKEIRKMPSEYLAGLLNIVRAFRESVALKPSKESFRQGWKEAMKGETMPVERLWDGIDAK